MIISRSVHLRIRNVSDENVRENQNTYFMFNKFFLKIVPLGQVEKCDGPRQATDDNIIMALKRYDLHVG
jgi:hypothetical protein